jgi:hypothetical protein
MYGVFCRGTFKSEDIAKPFRASCVWHCSASLALCVGMHYRITLRNLNWLCMYIVHARVSVVHFLFMHLTGSDFMFTLHV